MNDTTTPVLATDADRKAARKAAKAVAAKAAKNVAKTEAKAAKAVADAKAAKAAKAKAARDAAKATRDAAKADPIGQLSEATRAIIEDSTDAAKSFSDADVRFSAKSLDALLAIVDEKGTDVGGKDGAWTAVVLGYGVALKPSAGSGYLSHVRKAIDTHKWTTAMVREWTITDPATGEARSRALGLSSLGAYLAKLAKTDSDAPTDSDDSDAPTDSDDSDSDDSADDIHTDAEKLASSIQRDLTRMVKLFEHDAMVSVELWEMVCNTLVAANRARTAAMTPDSNVTVGEKVSA